MEKKKNQTLGQLTTTVYGAWSVFCFSGLTSVLRLSRHKVIILNIYEEECLKKQIYLNHV